MFRCGGGDAREYQAIIEAGFVLKLDDRLWRQAGTMINPEHPSRIPRLRGTARGGAEPRVARHADGSYKKK